MTIKKFDKTDAKKRKEYCTSITEQKEDECQYVTKAAFLGSRMIEPTDGLEGQGFLT